jgi:hypothetical protein
MGLLALGLFLGGGAATAQTTDKKPNILVIFGDDIGTWNVSAYSRGAKGQTPNIDRIANEGMLFTITTVSRAAPRDAPPSSRGRCRSAPG